MMLLIAFKDCDAGIPIRFRTDGSVFNLRRLQARTKTFAAVVSDLLYADDCALMAHTQAVAQQLFSWFLNAATRFDLTVSLRKTEVMLQPVNRVTSSPPVIMAGETLFQQWRSSAILAARCHLMRILTTTSAHD